MPLVDRVAIVVEVYGAVCQLCLRRWNTNLATKKLCGHKEHIDKYYCTLYSRQVRKTLYWLWGGRVN